MLRILRESRFGMNKCKERAKTSVYWSSIMRDIEQLVGACAAYRKFMTNQRKEPMIPHEIPDTPWTKVGSDIPEFQGTHYLIMVDYTSKYREICRMGKSKTASTVNAKLKIIFARFGIPRELIADNMPYGSYEMREFAHRWEFQVTKSSPTCYAEGSQYSSGRLSIQPGGNFDVQSATGDTPNQT